MTEKIKPYIKKEQIEARASELAELIKKDFQNEVYIIVVLTGAIVFFTDLMRQLNKLGVDVEFALIKLSSYKNDKSLGQIKLELPLSADIGGKDVLIVEDVADTGLTLSYLQEYLKQKGARSVKTCALLNKPSQRKEEIKLDYIGFEIENKFVVGYGLDYNEKYRDLDYIGIID